MGDPVFTKVEIFRGQSRGLKKSWLNIFSSQQVDESGQITDKKKVGYFKGRISVYNEEDAKAFKEEKRQKMVRIFNLIKQIHKTLYGQPLDFELDGLQKSQQQQQRLISKIEEMHLLQKDNNLIHFMTDTYNREQTLKKLLTQTQAQV